MSATAREMRRRALGVVPGMRGALIGRLDPYEGKGPTRASGIRGQVTREVERTVPQLRDVRVLLATEDTRDRVTIVNGGDPSRGYRDALLYSWGGPVGAQPTSGGGGQPTGIYVPAGQSVVIDRGVSRGELWVRVFGTWSPALVPVLVEEVVTRAPVTPPAGA